MTKMTEMTKMTKIKVFYRFNFGNAGAFIPVVYVKNPFAEDRVP
jgi:hypothetical protein